MGRNNYFILKNNLPGSCYYEFQPGKFETKHGKIGEMRLDNSLYLYGDDDGHYNYSVIAPFTFLISGSHPDPEAPKYFDPYGITYIDVNDGKKMIKNLRKFAELLENGETTLTALEKMGLYDPIWEAEWVEKTMKEENLQREQILPFDSDQRVSSLNIIKLKNTAEDLAAWAERIFAEYKWISILGI